MPPDKLRIDLETSWQRFRLDARIYTWPDSEQALARACFYNGAYAVAHLFLWLLENGRDKQIPDALVQLKAQISAAAIRAVYTEQ